MTFVAATAGVGQGQSSPPSTVTGPAIVLAKSRAVAGQEMTAPVWLQSAPELDGLSFEFVYDHKALDLKAIEPASTIAQTATLNSDTTSPGRAIVRIDSQQPLDGDAELFRARIVVRADAPQTEHKLTIENVSAWRLGSSQGDGSPDQRKVHLAVNPGKIVIDDAVPIWVVGGVIGAAIIFGLMSARKLDRSAVLPS